MPRPKPTKLNAIQERFVRMEANGWTSREIIKELWGLEEKDDPKTFHNKECMLSNWRKIPAYMDTWKDEISKVSVKLMNKGLGKILHQMDSSTEWLANKAANDGVNFAKDRIFRDEDRALTVHIAGMPELGSPDQDDG